MEKRIIKFRMWHNDTKCMYADTGLTSLGLNDAIEKALKSEYILMQFTGLHDKNGKEVYEGDVINHNKRLFEIKWSDSLAGWVARNYNTSMNFRQGDWINNVSKHIEIIGNIYENPELLNQ